MSTVLLVGAGAVGARAARQLVDTPGVERLLIADARPARAAEVGGVMGDAAEIVDWQPRMGLPDGVDAVACAVPAGDDVAIVRCALDAGVPCVSASDDTATIQELLELDRAAHENGVAIVVGAGLAPGLADVLARHAAESFDAVDEVNVARWCTAPSIGPRPQPARCSRSPPLRSPARSRGCCARPPAYVDSVAWLNHGRSWRNSLGAA